MAAVLFIAFFSIGVMAADDAVKGVVIDGKNIAITDVSPVRFLDNRTVSNLDFPQGVYITVAKRMGGERYPNAEALVRERFSSQGIKVTDKMDGASAMIMFGIAGSLDLADADKKAAYSSRPSTEQVVVNGGALIGGIVTSGPGAILGFAVGSMFPVDSKSMISAQVIMKPVITKGMFGENITSELKDGSFTNSIQVNYKLEKGNEATDDIALKMVADQWIKKFVLFDMKPSAPVAASAVQVVGSM